MTKEIVFMVEKAAEGGYQASAIGHSIFTEADTVEELEAMVQDAVDCHFDTAEKPLIIKTLWNYTR